MTNYQTILKKLPQISFTNKILDFLKYNWSFFRPTSSILSIPWQWHEKNNLLKSCKSWAVKAIKTVTWSESRHYRYTAVVFSICGGTCGFLLNTPKMVPELISFMCQIKFTVYIQRHNHMRIFQFVGKLTVKLFGKITINHELPRIICLLMWTSRID